MENAGRFNSNSPPPSSKHCSSGNNRMIHDTELGELKSLPAEINSISPSASVVCRNGACKAHHGLRPPHHRIENPWHYLKSIFLVSIIVAFVVWIIVYVLLTQYGVL